MKNNKEGSIKYFAYIRKSSESEDRQILSIPSQKEKIKEIFEDLDIEFVEDSKSAFHPENRPNFANMLDRIKQGKRTGIVAWHPNRLARNEIDAAQITYLVRMGIIEDLKFCSYTFNNEPEGIVMLQFALSQSQYESARKGKDVKRGMSQKADMGHPPYQAVNGYINVPGRAKGLSKWERDPERFILIRKAWDLLLTGKYTPMEVLYTLNKEWGYRTIKRSRSGGGPISRSTFYKMINDPAYYGSFEYPKKSGNFHEADYPRMISREEFNRTQMFLGGRGRIIDRKLNFPYTGLIHCKDCNCQITAEEKIQVICSECKNKFSCINKKICPACDTKIEDMHQAVFLNYTYYHGTRKKNPNCKNCRISISQDELEQQINDYLGKIEINKRYLEWAVKYLEKAHKLEYTTRETILKSQQRNYRKIAEKIDRLLELRLAGEVNEEEYRKKKVELLEEKERYQELLNDINNRQNQWLDLSEKTFNFAHLARTKFINGNSDKRREILAALGSNMTLKDGKISINAPQPFIVIKEGLEKVPEARIGFEHDKIGLSKRKKESLDSPNPDWLPGKDSNLQPFR